MTSLEEAERQASGAPGSGSEGRADAVPSRLHAVVRLGMSPTPRRQDAIVRSQMFVPQTLSTLLDLPI